LSLIQGGGIGDPLAPLCTRKGLDDEMSRADEPCFHRSCRLDGQQLLHEPLVNTAAALTKGLGQPKGLLGAIGLVLTQATRVHHGKVRTQAVADGLI
jgi:hypothetical protein